MRHQRLYCTTLFFALAVLGFCYTDQAQAGSITYLATVDTSTLDTDYGYLDVGLVPGGIGAAAVTATITNFLTDGTLNPNDPANNNPNNTYGDWSGSLTDNSNPLTLKNDVYTEFFEGFTYGKSIQFDVTLSGAAVNGSGTSPFVPFGSSFSFTLYDSTGFNPLLTTDPNGSVVTINVNGDGTTSVETFAESSSDSTHAATVVPAAGSVPAPPSLVLFILGIPAGLFYWRRSR